MVFVTVAYEHMHKIEFQLNGLILLRDLCSLSLMLSIRFALKKNPQYTHFLVLLCSVCSFFLVFVLHKFDFQSRFAMIFSYLSRTHTFKLDYIEDKGEKKEQKIICNAFCAVICQTSQRFVWASERAHGAHKSNVIVYTARAHTIGYVNWNTAAYILVWK